MQIRWFAVLGLLCSQLVTGCTPGYMKASQLEAQGQGPTACAKSCEDLGMRMTAMVLVGDSVPGCVCQPASLVAPAAPVPARPASNTGATEGAAASSGGFVVIAAAAAARQQQQQQQQQQHHTH